MKMAKEDVRKMHVEHIHGGDVLGAAKALGLEQSKIIDFSANINPLGPPPGVFDSISNCMDMIVHYPDPHCRELKEALSQYLEIKEKYIIMGNGVSELIYLLVRVLNCRRALIPVPTFTEYGIAVITAGGVVNEFPLQPEDGFRLDADKVISQLSPGDLIFVCNPNNPTGNLYPRNALLYLLKNAEAKDAYLVVDEAFIDFVSDVKGHSMVSRVVKSSNLIVFYSLTKFFGIPGLRLGAMIGPSQLVEKMVAAKDPWNVNLFAQVAGVAALKDVEHMKKTRELVKTERKYLYNRLVDLPGIKPFPGEANYLLVNIKGTGFKCGELTKLLGQRGVLVRDCSSFSGLGDDYIRVAVKTRAENRQLIAELAKVLEGERS